MARKDNHMPGGIIMYKTKFDNPIRHHFIDLQLFADEQDDSENIEEQLMALLAAEQEKQPKEQQQTQQVQPNTQTSDAPNEQQGLQQQDVEGQPTEKQGPQSSPVVDKLRRLGVTKFNNEDDFVKSYLEMEKMSTQNRQDLADLKAQNEQLIGMLQQMQGQANANQAPEEPQISDEEFMEMFYEKPIEALRQLISHTLEPELEPVKQSLNDIAGQAQWNQRVSDFAEQTPDLEQYQDAMVNVFAEYPELKNHPRGLEMAYAMAKGASGVADPNELLQDSQFVEQNILSNEQIRNKIIEDYLKQVQGGDAPVTIGTQPTSNQVPVTPPKRPQNMDEANKLALALFKK